MEIDAEFVAGLNSDLTRLLSKARVQQRLDMKLYNAEFVLGGCKGTCGSCFKELKDAKLMMVSEAQSVSNERYRYYTCEDCAKKLIKEFQEQYCS